MNSDAIDRSGPLTRTRSHDASGSAGSLAVAVAAVAFSTAGLFTRLIAADVWTMLFWRGLFGGLLIAAYIVWQQRGRTRAAFAGGRLARIGRRDLLDGRDHLFHRRPARDDGRRRHHHLCDRPVPRGGASRGVDRRTPPRTTLAASVVALIGVAIMCGGPLVQRRTSLGDLLALLMTGLMALMMVVIRKHRHVSMLPATCLSAFACAVAGASAGASGGRRRRGICSCSCCSARCSSAPACCS